MDLHLALCFFLSSGPRCVTSWPLWTRRTLFWQWHVQGWYFWYLHFARCVPCCCSQALMPCIMAGMDQSASMVSSWSFTRPLCATTFDCRKLCRLRSFSTFERGRRFFCRGAEAVPLGPDCSEHHRDFPSCSTLTRWSTSVVQVQQIPRVQSWRRQPSSHSCSSLNSRPVVACPLCATTDAVVDVLTQFIDGCGRR